MNGIQARTEYVEALQLSLHGQPVGILAHYSGGKNILTFDPGYRALPAALRPTFTLTQLVNQAYLDQPHVHNLRLPPVLSNLLPEGALRAWMAAALRVHPDREFPLLAWAGNNLPGALVATPVPMGGLPAWALSAREQVEGIQIEVGRWAEKFSLAGVQMKFSSVRREGRFNIGTEIGEDSWIIKTPSTLHPAVPANEFSMMRLAQAVGVDIPDIALVPLAQLDQLPDIPLPGEEFAYAIRRFDRGEQGRVHTEDFAQVFELYAHDKYGKKNYEQIGAILHRFSPEGLTDLQQMARRLLVNILLANGDAHLKNWTLVYPDRRNPRLSPAYDIVCTQPYVNGEDSAALNMARQKAWYDMQLTTFETWARRMDVSWSAIRVHLLDVLEQARERWPGMLKGLPMREDHRRLLRAHWQRLSPDFRIT
ncbi:type II toxin-antitoxin system HipA family toxin [Zobellella denitrificans]